MVYKKSNGKTRKKSKEPKKRRIRKRANSGDKLMVDNRMEERNLISPMRPRAKVDGLEVPKQQSGLQRKSNIYERRQTNRGKS